MTPQELFLHICEQNLSVKAYRAIRNNVKDYKQFVQTPDIVLIYAGVGNVNYEIKSIIPIIEKWGIIDIEKDVDIDESIIYSSFANGFAPSQASLLLPLLPPTGGGRGQGAGGRNLIPPLPSLLLPILMFFPSLQGRGRGGSLSHPTNDSGRARVCNLPLPATGSPKSLLAWGVLCGEGAGGGENI